MKRFEKYAIFVLIVWLLQSPIVYIATSIYYQFFSVEQIGQLGYGTIFYYYTMMLIKSLVNVSIGIWLFAMVKKEKTGTPWIWLTMAVFAGILAPILYFLIRIYKTVKPENELVIEQYLP